MNTATVQRTYLVGFMLTMAFVAYMSFTQPIKTERPAEQQMMYALVPEALPGPPPTAASADEGEALAYMKIPRFGKNWFWTVSEGTDLPILDKGPGHFVGTALPGEDGNTAYAAHRATHGDPFLDFDQLEVGDTVTIAQSGAEWTYEILFEPRIIEEDESWVTLQQTRRGKEFWVPRLTLVTCWPKYGSEKRMYVRARLVATD